MERITIIAQMLSEEIQQELPAAYSLTDIEQVTRRLGQEIGRQAMAKVFNAEEIGNPETALCRHCKREMPYVRRHAAQLRTLFGYMAVKRAYYLCPECSQGCCPLDQRLRLRL